jgi:hypothetical protein
MFGWFSPTCPLRTAEKTWTERRMLWLVDRFGMERLRLAEVILPTEDYFPEHYRGTSKDARRIFERLCDWMNVDAGRLRFQVCEDFQLPGVSGHYDTEKQPIIRIGRGQLADLVNTIAVLAHELSHEILLGGGHLTAHVSDHEWVTDLLPVFLGLGIFAANATIQEAHETTGNYSWWSVRRLGYLSMQVFGYALAAFAFLRDELEPAWAEYLRPDAASVLAKGLRFLTKNTDSLLHPTMEPFRRPASGLEDWTARLEHRSPTVRLSTLWDLVQTSLLDADLVEPVAACLRDADADVPPEAAYTLGEFGPLARAAIAQLSQALWQGHDPLRAAAAYALGRLAPVSADLIPDLTALLGEHNWGVIAAVSGALRGFGRQAEAAVAKLLAPLERAIVECNQPLIEDLSWTLVALSPDPERAVCDAFRAEAEVRRRALATLEQLQRRPNLRPSDKERIKAAPIPSPEI